MPLEHDQHRLAQTLGTVARRLESEPDLEQTLQGITHAAVATVPGAVHAGISLVEGRKKITAHAPTHDLIKHADQWQIELNEGPCMDAIWEAHTVVVDDMSTETRWPRFAARAVENGLGSMLSFQLFVERNTLGALNLYATDDQHFDGDARVVGELFATHAAVALSGANRARQYNEAMATRDLIGQAKGLLMARDNLTGQEAFTRLVRSSQDTNIKLAEVAGWLVHEHEDPGDAPRPRNS